MDRLAKLYRREKAWPALVVLLQRARDLSNEASEQARLQFEIAEITEMERGDDEGAVAAYLQVLELDPNAMQALTALERLYTKLDRSAELLRIYDRQLELADPSLRVHLLFKAAQIWEEKLSNAGYAAACLEGVLAIEPQNVRALKALESIYRKLADWQRLAATLERHIAASGDPAEAAALTLAMGEVWYKELNRADQAELIFNHVLELDPSSPQALAALGRLYERSGNWGLALDMIRREIRVTAIPAHVIELHYRAGKIQEEMLGDVAEARTAYGRCLEIDPGYLPALKALKVIHEQAKDFDRYLDVLQQEAQVTPDGPEKTELLFEVGKFYRSSARIS
jgi:tetratricopeptide (TPR) repeat protein